MRIPLQFVGALGIVACLACTAPGASAQSQSKGESQIPENATTLEGRPAVKVDTTREGGTRQALGDAESAKNRLLIRKVGSQYFWTSRENLPLKLSTAGEFTYLSSAEPGKYIRLRRLNDVVTYVEHVDMPFGSVTYFGELRFGVGK